MSMTSEGWRGISVAYVFLLLIRRILRGRCGTGVLNCEG